MLILSSKLNNTPIMSLQTGGQLAIIDEPLINPANLQIIAYKLQEYETGDWLIRIADIREISKLGFIIDSGDEFIQPTDVIKINEIFQLDFHLNNISVVDENGAKIGKVIDYTLDLSSFVIQQLIIKRPLFKSFNDPELTIHRNQITAIDNHKITIKSEHHTTKLSDIHTPKTEEFVPNYVNPFRG